MLRTIKKTIKAFSLIEVVVAIVVSSMSMVAMSRISIQVTQQAIINERADQAVQISSKTSEILLRLRLQTPYPIGYCSASVDYTSDYLTQDAAGVVTLTPILPNGYTVVNWTPQNVNISPKASLPFVQDNMLTTDEVYAGYSRSIGLYYIPLYKVVNARVIITWSSYKVQNYYVNFSAFSVNCS